MNFLDDEMNELEVIDILIILSEFQRCNNYFEEVPNYKESTKTKDGKVS
jgi:hypothetical protein